MKGVNFVTNTKGRKIAVQIDIQLLMKSNQDLIDVIIAVSRKDDEDVSWERAKKELKKSKNQWCQKDCQSNYKFCKSSFSENTRIMSLTSSGN